MRRNPAIVCDSCITKIRGARPIAEVLPDNFLRRVFTITIRHLGDDDSPVIQ